MSEARTPEEAGREEIRPRCDSCAHFEALTGECRAEPPKMIMTQQGPGGLWPPTRADKWCGKHTAHTLVRLQ
jgi:hypothetical protein